MDLKRKQDPTISFLKETYFKIKYFKNESQGMKIDLQRNGSYKQTSIAILLSNIVDLNLKSIRRDI